MEKKARWKKKRDGKKKKRMLCAVLNKLWKQHSAKLQLNGY